MSKPRIVILGGTGFVGRHLAPRLVAAGYAVDVLSRNREIHRGVGLTNEIRVHSLDAQDPAALASFLHGAAAVINLVGILNEAGRDGRGFQRAHVELTRSVVQACEDAGVPRLLQMSALNAGRGSSHYLRTRGEAERLVRDSRLQWTIFQPSVIFGRGDGLFTRFAGLLRMLPVLPLARAQARFAPIYVGDVVEAFCTALVRADSIGQSYELYGDRVLSLAEIVRLTADALGLRRWILPLPDGLARLQAALFDFVPGKPFSTDNYRSLLTDSVGGIDGMVRLGLRKTPLESVLPRLFGAYGRQGRLDSARRVR